MRQTNHVFRLGFSDLTISIYPLLGSHSRAQVLLVWEKDIGHDD